MSEAAHAIARATQSPSTVDVALRSLLLGVRDHRNRLVSWLVCLALWGVASNDDCVATVALGITVLSAVDSDWSLLTFPKTR